MGFLSHIASYFTNDADPAATDKRNEIATPLLASKRFLVVVGAVALLYVSHEIFTPETMKIIRDIVIGYMICETVTKVTTIAGNILLKHLEIHAAVAPVEPAVAPMVIAKAP